MKESERNELRRKIKERERHRIERMKLRELILGGQDGLVNVLGVVLAVASASNDSKLVIIAGAAALFVAGAVKAELTVGKWWMSGLELALIGCLQQSSAMR